MSRQRLLSETRGSEERAVIDYASTIEACANGDAEALRELYEVEGPRLMGVAQRILRRRDLAEEAVQEAFAQIWRNASRYDRTLGSARGWIYAIVRYRALNMVRDGSREQAMPQDDLDRLRDESVTSTWSGLDPDGLLRRCLEALDSNRRSALLMVYVLGLTHGEVAGQMRVPLGTAKAWIRRALQSLRECMS
jgi:RNA polymerase sigma-70 factor (ECF subfamily)